MSVIDPRKYVYTFGSNNGVALAAAAGDKIELLETKGPGCKFSLSEEGTYPLQEIEPAVGATSVEFYYYCTSTGSRSFSVGPVDGTPLKTAGVQLVSADVDVGFTVRDYEGCIVVSTLFFAWALYLSATMWFLPYWKKTHKNSQENEMTHVLKA
eukprot:TRINITY_DN3941_c0_g1_i1.p1 TRINITY_DN3941_c0_g1~~TRINITY_DN3941_c0_g1_i1.p1  ORF type:complete len:154 (-),score=35.03 TRINITY_DN3941_c0_g1_i1:84-545(-)